MNITKLKSIAAAALCAVGLSAFAAKPEAVQLWEGGPYWATVNVGTSEVQDHPEYGALYKFTGDEAKNAAESLGEGWRLPTKEEFEALLSNCDNGTWTEQNGVKGCLFTSKSDPSKSIFLPAAGFDSGDGRVLAGLGGCCWSSKENGASEAWHLIFSGDGAEVDYDDRSRGFSVRAVRDTPLVSGPSVTVDKVESVEPWDSTKGAIKVEYTLGGVDAATKYKVAFDVTAGGQTASVTNDAAKLTDGAATKEINTVEIFGKEVVDTKAKVKVSLIAIKPIDYSKPVQLWAGGPLFAQCNVGATKPGDYGELYTFDGNKAADAAASLGDGWRLPTKDELQALLDNCGEGVWTEQSGVNGRLFTGKGDYSSNSIFLPAAGYCEGSGARLGDGEEGDYWSATPTAGGGAGDLILGEDFAEVDGYGDRSLGFSVRAVRNAE